MKEMQAKAASKPEIMHSQAMIYTDAEIYALAQYLASLSGGGSNDSGSKEGRDDDDDHDDDHDRDHD
jgi:cytochrome c553